MSSRRNFLKTGAFSLTGATLLAGNFNSAIANTSKERTFKPVFRKFGNTGLNIPLISFGTGDTNNPKLIEAAHDNGIVLFATSQYYGNGNNEKMLGQVFKEKKRDSFLIATSVMPAGFNHKTGMFDEGATADSFIKGFESSLANLNADYVDILFLPFAAKRESVFYEPYLKAMENIKKQGKARFIGIATHMFEDEAIRAAVDVKIYDLVMTAFNFRKSNIQAIKESIAYASSAGLGVIAMKTQAGGYWDKEKTKAINSRAAIKWVLQDENIHTVVPGCTTVNQVLDNISIMEDIHLTDDELKDLQLAGITPNSTYCQQCGECIPQCPHGLDIPTYMRSYMYAYGYKNTYHARETLDFANESYQYCDECQICNVSCKMGFDVKTKIADIRRLKQVPHEFLYS